MIKIIGITDLMIYWPRVVSINTAASKQENNLFECNCYPIERVSNTLAKLAFYDPLFNIKRHQAHSFKYWQLYDVPDR